MVPGCLRAHCTSFSGCSGLVAASAQGTTAPFAAVNAARAAWQTSSQLVPPDGTLPAKLATYADEAQKLVVAAAIGAGGLGDYIFRGLSMTEPTLILAGAVPAGAGGEDAAEDSLEECLHRVGLHDAGDDGGEADDGREPRQLGGVEAGFVDEDGDGERDREDDL